MVARHRGRDGSVSSSRRRCWTSRAGIRASPKGWPKRQAADPSAAAGSAWPDQRSLPVPSGRCTASITAGPASGPEGVSRCHATDPRTMSDRDLQLFGCAAADAWMVGSILADKNYNNRHTLRDTYLPVSRPWSLIFPDPSESEMYSSGQTLMALSSWTYGQPPTELPPPRDEMGLPNTLRRRGRMAIYEDPAPVRRPPDYVLDLMEGTPQAGLLLS